MNEKGDLALTLDPLITFGNGASALVAPALGQRPERFIMNVQLEILINTANVLYLFSYKAVAEILPGQFIGSISFITEETASADIVALEPTCYVTWPKTKLKKFMEKNSELHTALQRTLAIDLARSVQDAWAR